MTKVLSLAVVVLLLLALFLWGWGEHESRQAGTFKAERDSAIETRDTEARERRLESRRAVRLQEITDAEVLARQSVEAAARRAAVADSSLRGELARVAARARAASADSAAASEREAAIAAVPVLTGLLDQCSERRTELARFADESRLAGLTCQRAYDALSEPTVGR